MARFLSKEKRPAICGGCGNDDLIEGKKIAGLTEYTCKKCGHVDFYTPSALKKM